MKSPAQNLFKELFKVESIIDFNLMAQNMASQFKIKNSEEFDFDPVERKYDDEGNLISNFGKKKKNKKKRKAYKGKVVLQ